METSMASSTSLETFLVSGETFEIMSSVTVSILLTHYFWSGL